jgi:hypothetical protein
LYYFSETKNIITAFAKQPGLIMEKKHSCLIGLFILIILSMGSINAVAQEAGSPSFEAYEKDPSERVFYTHGDSLESTQRKDTAAVRMPLKRNVYKPAPAAPKEKTSGDDNSILSFNFLYYLIQKYKMQDIVD